MLARVQSYVLQGIDALPCEVEVDLDVVGEKAPRPVVVGLPDTAVKESAERMQSALINSGYLFPHGRLLINLAPADVRKEGPLYDLPIALGILVTQGVVGERRATSRGRANGSAAKVAAVKATTGAPAAAAPLLKLADGAWDPIAESDAGPAWEPLDYRRYLIAGELALDGRVRPIRGVIAMAALAKARGLAGVIVPAENAAEAAVVSGVEAIGVTTLSEVVGLFNGQIEPRPHPPTDVESMLKAAPAPVDFADVRGQEAVKRAIVVAAAGSHNLVTLCASAGHRRWGRSQALGHNVLALWASDGDRCVNLLTSNLGAWHRDQRRSAWWQGCGPPLP